ncbi:hypothetical protein [Halalkalibacter sp. APA_J-10(15)]|uniref:hypothetical protein n=2 Tax=unclassified Halalkalibacter TaxID=2893063 RepID=UPI001FF582D6|nr:hypothetical protein [Halalkalibacter sp. APA_J-10(15)]MCK0471977.1 hypothetical protein [Halalkalibacter sp. APA_J-10(15)]
MMSYYEMCCKYKGQRVCITDKCGRKHVGTITHVTNTHVFIQPDSSEFGGFNYGYWGWGGYPIAFGFIAGLALASLFFW